MKLKAKCVSSLAAVNPTSDSIEELRRGYL
jgi:hypothetical protein